MPKCSIVSIGVHTDALDWVKKFKPVSFLLVNERGQASPEKPWTNREIDLIRDAMGASPKTLWIFRSWPDGIREGGKMALGFRMMRCFEPFQDLGAPLMGHSYNEPGFPWIGASGAARELMYLEKDFARQMHDAGLLSMNFCFSESHILKGNMGLWEIFAEALPYVDALGFNEYDWPWVFTSRDQGYKWRIGHWEHQVLRLEKLFGGCGLLPSKEIPPIIIGEGILDGKIGYPHPYGWQKRWRPEKYIEMHLAVHHDTYLKRQVFSHHTFCYCHPSSEWRSYSVEPILEDLGKLIQGQVYWEDFVRRTPDTPEIPNNDDQENESNDQGDISMSWQENWKNVPEKIRRWRPLIAKAVRGLPASPIPDYNGVHVTPTRVMACIIQVESGGDPRAVGGAGHAHGLMQVWKDHHLGRDLFDPEVNIRTGLEIFEAKLNISKDLHEALYYYSGGEHWASIGTYNEKYWERFMKCYKQFWGDALEPSEESDPIQLAIKKIESAQITQKAAHEASMRDLDDAKEGLLGWEG